MDDMNKILYITQIKLVQSNQGLYYKTFHGRKLRIYVISLSVCPWLAFPALSNVYG
jgi:hypothetical protein